MSCPVRWVGLLGYCGEGVAGSTAILQTILGLAAVALMAMCGMCGLIPHVLCLSTNLLVSWALSASRVRCVSLPLGRCGKRLAIASAASPAGSGEVVEGV